MYKRYIMWVKDSIWAYRQEIIMERMVVEKPYLATGMQRQFVASYYSLRSDQSYLLHTSTVTVPPHKKKLKTKQERFMPVIARRVVIP